MTKKLLTLENIRSGAVPSDAVAVGFLLGELEKLRTQMEILQRANRFLSEQIPSALEPGVVTRLPVPGTQMTRLSDIADELIRQLRKQGMEKMQAVFDGMRLRIDPWPEPQAASRDASPADLVGALQDVVHTDPGPVRAGKAVKSPNPIICERCGLNIAGLMVHECDGIL